MIVVFKGFNIYLCLVGIIWLIWLHVDISKYIRMIREYSKGDRSKDDIASTFELEEGPNGELLISIPISSKRKKIPEYYCFSTGRHSGSFYLKIGAAAFCLGHLIQNCLNIARQVRI